MSNKNRQSQYADPKGVLMETFLPNVSAIAEGDTLPTDGTSGYSAGSLFLKRPGAVGAALYINEGSNTSCAFKAVPTQAATGLAGLAVSGVAAGYKLARGVGALDGSNPTPITTGLTTVVAAVVCLDGTAAPGLGTSVLTVASTNYATGALAVYGWKVTGSGDATLIASTGTDAFEWIAVGT